MPCSTAAWISMPRCAALTLRFCRSHPGSLETTCSRSPEGAGELMPDTLPNAVDQSRHQHVRFSRLLGFTAVKNEGRQVARGTGVPPDGRAAHPGFTAVKVGRLLAALIVLVIPAVRPVEVGGLEEQALPHGQHGPVRGLGCGDGLGHRGLLQGWDGRSVRMRASRIARSTSAWYRCRRSSSDRCGCSRSQSRQATQHSPRTGWKSAWRMHMPGGGMALSGAGVGGERGMVTCGSGLYEVITHTVPQIR